MKADMAGSVLRRQAAMHSKLPEIDDADYAALQKLTLGLADTVHSFRHERDRGLPMAAAGQSSHTIELVRVTPAAFARFCAEKRIPLPATVHELHRFASDFEVPADT